MYICTSMYISAGPFRGHQAAKRIVSITVSKSFQVDSPVFQYFQSCSLQFAVCLSGISF